MYREGKSNREKTYLQLKDILKAFRMYQSELILSRKTRPLWAIIRLVN